MEEILPVQSVLLRIIDFLRIHRLQLINNCKMVIIYLTRKTLIIVWIKSGLITSAPL